ncbi:MAG: cell division protein ZapA [Succinivibrionaceae bacterium]
MTQNTDNNIFETEQVSLEILNRTYNITCKKGEGDNYKIVAKEIIKRIEDFKKMIPNFNNEQILVLTALDICHDLYNQQLKYQQFSDIVENRTKEIGKHLKNVLKDLPS